MAGSGSGVRLPEVAPERLRDAVRAALCEQGDERTISGASAGAFASRLPSMAQLVGSAEQVLQAQEQDGPAAEYFVALLELGYLVASADGLAPEEREALALLLENATGATVSRSDLQLHFVDLDATVAALGRSERLLRAAASFETAEARAEAVSFAALVAMADGRLEPAEMSVLEQLGAQFAMSAEDVERTVEDVAARIKRQL